MVRKYRREPIVVKALQYYGVEDFDKVKDFAGEAAVLDHNRLYIKTLQDWVRGDVGDYIIKDENGEFYPCKPDVFVVMYKPVSE